MLLSNFIVLGCSTSITKTDSPFATLKIQGMVNDESKNLSLNVWGTPKGYQLKLGTGLSCSKVKEASGFYSCQFSEILTFELPPDDPRLKLIPSPIEKEKWDNLMASLMLKVKATNPDPQWIEYLEELIKKIHPLYILHPAAKGNHHAYPGGLLNHVYEILNIFNSIYDTLPFKVRPEIVITGCLFHDYGKISEYKNGGLTEEMFLMGHIYMGSHTCHKSMESKGLPYKDITRTIHTVLAHHGRLDWGSPVVPATTEAFLVYHLDALSGHGVMYGEASHMEAKFGTKIIK